jgi:hypothetical protein
MDEVTVQYPEGAENLLKRLPTAARLKGQALYNAGQVQNIEEAIPGLVYDVFVLDGEDYEVALEGYSAKRWNAECTCEQIRDCEHITAALLALLAEHRTSRVRSLSARSPAPSTAVRSTQVALPGLAALDLAQQLEQVTGSPPDADQKRFLRELHNLFLRCSQTRSIGSWDLAPFGWRMTGSNWGQLSLWPSFPKTEQEFWLYIVNAVREAGGEVPVFLLPISDTATIEPRLKAWKRTREIKRWQEALANIPIEPIQPAVQAGETDVRLVLDEDEACLQLKRPGAEGFERIKATQARKLAEDHEQGLVNFTVEGELLWQLFTSQDSYRPAPCLDYDEPDVEALLSKLLRLRVLEGRICNPQGQPLRRATEPLRWELIPALSDEDDYRLRLVKPDGSPAPLIVAVLRGNPTLYLTPEVMFPGPDPAEGVLNPLAENCIPAPALEKSAGVALLDSLGLALPERLKHRVQKVPYEVAITCELKPTWFGAEEEDCHVQVLAEALDGCQKTWGGGGWVDSKGKRGRRTGESADVIHVYDTALLRAIPTLLVPLKLKPGGYGSQSLVIRVNKKFPETFSAWIKSLPPQITLQLKGDLSSFLAADVAGRVKLDASEVDIDWFDLRVVLDVADTTLTPDEIKLLLNAKGRYVRLEGKGWKRLQYDLSEDENEKLARLGLSARELSAEPQRLHALQLADDSARKFLPAQQVEQIQRRAGEIKARVSPDLPQGVTAQLRPYQLEGFHFLAYLATNRFGGILADDMGLGKTVQTLAWLVWLREQRTAPPGAPSKLPPSLVVCPKSVMDNWHVEAGRFTPALRVKVWPAGQVASLATELESADLHVLNYSQLRGLGESLAPVPWFAVILDEGQYIKNPNSQTAQVARALRAEYRLVLSGTPIENRLLDLWSLMAFVMPGVLGSRAQFARLYDTKGDPFARRRLGARVRPFVLRRTKAQVARDLPDRIEEDLLCELEGEQLTLYRAELKRAQQLLLSIKSQKELAQQQFHFLTSLLRLRQICCHPRLVNPLSTASGAKAEALLEQLEPLMDEGQKVLVFSQFVGLLNLLTPLLEARKWPLFYLAGDTENRGELVRQFQSAEGPAIFLISLKAGGFGLNLTAASYVVLFDPWWNPAVENQAIDRTHRIGQVNKVNAYRLLIKNSVEEKIRELQKKKKALAEDVLGEEKFAQGLTLDDLRFLFSD